MEEKAVIESAICFGETLEGTALPGVSNKETTMIV